MTARNKHSPLNFPQYKKSFALISDAPEAQVKRAIVFIHGFNGSANSTWSDFLSLVDDASTASAWWEAADLFFFDYQWDSVFSQLVNNTLKIYRFIEDIFPKPDGIGRAHAYRSEAFEYEELVLVGHSEGGLLLRKVIVEAAQRNSVIKQFMQDSRYQQTAQPSAEGMLKASVRLFAPALGGDMQSGLIGVLTSLPLISSAISSSAAKKGMDQSSPSVTEARKRTDRFAEYVMLDCFRAHIVWAEKDSIVNSEKYDEDLQCLQFPTGSTHTSICKPKVNYPLPLTFVEEGVSCNECQ